MKQTTIVTVILAVLVLISVVQAVQLNGLKAKLTGGELGVISSSSGNTALTTTPSSGSGKRVSSLPSSIKDLPQMVGGC
ncbi:MAG: hypothetical protein QF362_00610 [Candidatus Woesearchaeota archaeon]|jgi:hypothetical protein|nr:hypothetical protein [Candidatus Woesearchaeota archaeon]MDP7505932.1 hypothetical protein [Candidatus Woesearchaeota archaeon]|tara:strand:- start:259 stop:495 length:237 start_codon:yes stop_codon:yes gene_type:complete